MSSLLKWSPNPLNLKNNYSMRRFLNLNLSSGNIFEGIERGFVDKLNDDYRLSTTSGLVDMGTTDIDDDQSQFSIVARAHSGWRGRHWPF